MEEEKRYNKKIEDLTIKDIANFPCTKYCQDCIFYAKKICISFEIRRIFNDNRKKEINLKGWI